MIDILKKRQRKLKRRIAKEMKEYRKLRYKSSHLRRTSLLNPRIGLFKDHLLELEHDIYFLEGKITEKQFLNYQDGDELDMVLKVVMPKICSN